VSFGSNKSKAYIITKVNLNAFANGAYISTNLCTSRIDLVDVTIDERVEKGFEVKKKKQKAKWELNQSF
jgi:hypothetical protein